MTSTTFLYCGTTYNTLRPELLKLLAEGHADSANMRHIRPLAGRVAYTDFSDQLRRAGAGNECVQLLFDCRGSDCRGEMSGYLETARDIAVSPCTLELAMICDSERTEADYGRLIAAHSNPGKSPIVWSVVAENSDQRLAAMPFIRLLAALALAKYPSRMHGYDSLSSLRNLKGLLISNRILWFSFPPLSWVSTTLLRREIWRSGFVNQGQENLISKIQELLLRHGFGKSEPQRSARSMFLARVSHFRSECLPQVYDLVAASSVDCAQASAILAQVANELHGEGFGPLMLRSQAAAEAIHELVYELPALAAAVESDAVKLENAAAEYPPLEEWIRSCQPIVSESLARLRASSWSALGLIASASFMALRRRGELAWQTAIEPVSAKLQRSFVLWKHRVREELSQEMAPLKRVLEFLPPELTTDSNEELWPLKDHVALIGQRENPLS